ALAAASAASASARLTAMSSLSVRASAAIRRPCTGSSRAPTPRPATLTNERRSIRSSHGDPQPILYGAGAPGMYRKAWVQEIAAQHQAPAPARTQAARGCSADGGHLQPDDAGDDQQDAANAQRRGRLVKQDDAGDGSAHRTDAHPDARGSARRQRAHGQAEQIETAAHGEQREHAGTQ